MRGRNLRHGLPSSERCDAVSPSDAMVKALDAALRFVGSRELLTSHHVEGLLAMLRVASSLGSEPGPVCDALDSAVRSFEAREVVSGTELLDRLLDIRLAVRAPRPERLVTVPDPFSAYPLIRA